MKALLQEIVDAVHQDGVEASMNMNGLQRGSWIDSGLNDESGNRIFTVGVPGPRREGVPLEDQPSYTSTWPFSEEYNRFLKRTTRLVARQMIGMRIGDLCTREIQVSFHCSGKFRSIKVSLRLYLVEDPRSLMPNEPGYKLDAKKMVVLRLRGTSKVLDEHEANSREDSAPTELTTSAEPTSVTRSARGDDVSASPHLSGFTPSVRLTNPGGITGRGDCSTGSRQPGSVSHLESGNDAAQQSGWDKNVYLSIPSAQFDTSGASSARSSSSVVWSGASSPYDPDLERLLKGK